MGTTYYTFVADYVSANLLEGINNPDELDQIICIIDHAGGPQEWMHLMFEDEAGFEKSMNQAETKCGAMTPTS